MQRKRHVDGTAPAATAWPRVKVLHVLEAIEGGTARHIVNVVRHVDADHVVVVPPERVGGLTDLAAF